MKGRSIWAVVAAILFTFIVTTLVDMALHATGVYPPVEARVPLTDSLAMLATAYRFLIGIAAGWLTARLAPANPMTHAIALGLVGIVLGLAGVIATWNAGLGPRWYAIGLVVLAVPQSWLGGKLYVKQRQSA
jgi:hypothetical protein